MLTIPILGDDECWRWLWRRAESSDLIGRAYAALCLYDRALPLLEDAIALHREVGRPMMLWPCCLVPPLPVVLVLVLLVLVLR